MSKESSPETAVARAAATRTRLRLEDRTRWLGRLGALTGMAFGSFALVLLAPEEMRAALAILSFSLVLMLGLIVACLPAIAAALSPKRQSQLMIEAEPTGELRVGNVTLAPSSVGTAWAKTPHTVEILTTDGDELEIDLPDATSTAHVVGFLRRHLDARPAYAVRLESDGLRLTRKTWAWLAPMSAAAVLSWFGPMFLLSFVGAVGFGLLFSRGTHRARFGADGVVIEGRHRQRYVAYKDIERVGVHTGPARTNRVYVDVRDGRRMRLGFWIDSERARLVAALLEEGAAMARAGADAGAHVAELEREAEGDDDWLARVSALTRAGSYRGTAIDVERLATLMRNPSAAAGQRVAAALALREEPSNLPRIRVAASVSSEPEVRDALRELATEDLDADRIERVVRRFA